MKILWVKAGGLVPLDSGGKIRSYHIARALAKRHEVTLFTYYVPFAPDPHSELKNLFADVVTVPLRARTGRDLFEAIDYARLSLSKLPYSIRKYSSGAVSTRLERMLSERPYDVLLCDFVGAGGVIPWDRPIPKVVFTHNVEAMIWKRHAEVATNPLWRMVFRRECGKMEAVEKDYLTRADHVLTVSDTDSDYFGAFVSRDKITTIPTGVDIDFFRPQSEADEPGQIVFTGSMDWMPNEDGVLYFTQEIYPLILERQPRAVLWIVGRTPSARIRALADASAQIKVTGRVDDIRPYIARAAAYVVPLRVGGGTRLKIFEAMAMGKAVVSTTIGAEGLPVTHGRDGWLADTPRDFADAVCRMLEDEPLRREMGRAARDLVASNYSWDSVSKKFAFALQSAARNHAGQKASAGE
jgi:polysaccharide biosynthesis protein PslH